MYSRIGLLILVSVSPVWHRDAPLLALSGRECQSERLQTAGKLIAVARRKPQSSRSVESVVSRIRENSADAEVN
jgi:hypothetical protein